MGAKWICILIGINETQWTTFDSMRNDVLQNYLDHIFEMFGFIILTTWNFKMQAKLQFIRPPNSYILHCHSKSGLFTIYLRGNGMKNSKSGKSWILYMYTLGSHCKIFNYGFQRGTLGCQMNCILVGINETQGNTFDFMRNDVLQNYFDQFLKCLAL